MSRAQRFLRVFGFPLLAAMAVACGSEAGPTDPGTCEGGNCDETPFTPKCKAQLIDRSGRRVEPLPLNALRIADGIAGVVV